MSYALNAKKIGQAGFIKLGKLKIEVKVVDYKNSYGKDRWLVTPKAGIGETWVEEILFKKQTEA